MYFTRCISHFYSLHLKEIFGSRKGNIKGELHKKFITFEGNAAKRGMGMMQRALYGTEFGVVQRNFVKIYRLKYHNILFSYGTACFKKNYEYIIASINVLFLK